MAFMGIMDFASSSNKNANDYLTLRIGVGNGVDVIPDMDINLTDLNKSGVNKQKHFFNNGYGGITFKVMAYIRYAAKNKQIIKSKTDMWGNRPVKDVLHEWFINMTPLSVVTDAIDVPDGRYIITKNSSRKQTHHGVTSWELEFTSYTPLTLFRWKNDNSNVLTALKKNKAKPSSSKNKNEKLAKCNYKVLKYSKKKKVVECVKYLQKVLKKKKCYTGAIDGWYGKDTTKAVKKFQKKYNKKNITTKTTNTMNGIIVKKGKLLTNTNTQYADVPEGTKINTNAAKSKATKVTIKGINKILPETGKVDKATFKALVNA